MNIDAVNETEDHTDPVIADINETVIDGDGDNIEQPEGLPNNDFCFTEADFLETRNQMNDATRHQGTFHEAWSAIRALEGREVMTTSSKFGDLIWTVVPSTSLNEDKFAEIRQNELRSMKEKVIPIRTDDDSNKFTSESDFNAAFWSLWPVTIDEDVLKLNEIIVRDNRKRKENYQRPIRLVSQKEFITFHALLIGATAYSEVGEQLWSSDSQHSNKKRRKGISSRTDFGRFMKLWRFKQIRQYLPGMMEDEEKKESDPWWKFSSRVTKFNGKKLEKMKSSHIHVFDESMSAYVPR